MLSLYVPGASAIHRAPAWVKLLILCVVGTATMVVGDPVLLALEFAAIATGYALARVPWATIWRMARSLLVLVAIVGACQWLFSSITLAVVVSLRLVCLVTAANLLTTTTPLADLISTIESALAPLARFGVKPDRLGIAIGLVLRFIPMISEQASYIRQAQAARGVRAPFTYLVPLVIRTLRMADGVGEALEARRL